MTTEDDIKKPDDIKRADVILLIDDRDDMKQQQSEFSPIYEETIQPERQLKPISLRALSVFGFVFSALLSFFSLLILGTLVLLSTLLLFQNQKINSGIKVLWKIYSDSVLAGFCFALCFIAPTIGLGLLVAHFSLKKDPSEQNFIMQIVRNLFMK